MKALFPLAALAVCAITACSDAGEARLNRNVDQVIDSAGNKLERLGDRIDAKVRNAVADARAPKDAVDTANQANDVAFKDDRNRRDDARWATQSLADGLLEVELAGLAATNSTSDAVKGLAATLATDHARMNESLRSLASSKSIRLPASLSSTGQDKLIQLTQKTGTDFDRAYLDYAASDHRDAANRYADLADHGHDLELRRFAAKQVPVLKRHVEVAMATQKAAGTAH